MVTKADLHQVIDDLPDGAVSTDEERAAMAEAHADLETGADISDADPRRELGL
ncbi:MAG: hypothetical protein ACYDCQ_12520 [Dehalococcoidia bacterium]